MAWASLTDQAAPFLHASVRAELNVVSSGIYQRMTARTQQEAGTPADAAAHRLRQPRRPRSADRGHHPGRTLTKRATDVPANLDRPGTSNDPTEPINGRLGHLRGSAPASGISPTTSPDPASRQAASGPDYTPNCEEPLHPAAAREPDDPAIRLASGGGRDWQLCARCWSVPVWPSSSTADDIARPTVTSGGTQDHFRRGSWFRRVARTTRMAPSSG
jgi:hypothetical protein